MSDIVERLRADDLWQQDEETVLAPLCREAAAEIERLRALLREAADHIDGVTGARARLGQR